MSKTYSMPGAYAPGSIGARHLSAAQRRWLDADDTAVAAQPGSASPDGDQCTFPRRLTVATGLTLATLLIAFAAQLATWAPS